VVSHSVGITLQLNLYLEADWVYLGGHCFYYFLDLHSSGSLFLSEDGAANIQSLNERLHSQDLQILEHIYLPSAFLSLRSRALLAERASVVHAAICVHGPR